MLRTLSEKLCVLCGETKTQTKSIQNHEQRNLEQDPEHRDYRTYRHRHHLRCDFLYRRVNERKGCTFWSVSLFLYDDDLSCSLSLMINNLDIVNHTIKL